MKVLHKFPKEFVDLIKSVGITVDLMDENLEPIRYINLPHWFKLEKEDVFECDFYELPEDVKRVHRNYNSGIIDWYDGNLLKSKSSYYVDDADLKQKIEFMHFMIHSGEYIGDKPKVSFYIRFKDMGDKYFQCEQNEDGSLEKDSFQNSLQKADEYLCNLKLSNNAD